jgi:hypothetical protein
MDVVSIDIVFFVVIAEQTEIEEIRGPWQEFEREQDFASLSGVVSAHTQQTRYFSRRPTICGRCHPA